MQGVNIVDISKRKTLPVLSDQNAHSQQPSSSSITLTEYKKNQQNVVAGSKRVAVSLNYYFLFKKN